MPADHVYFVASPDEAKSLDPARSPVGQLPAERVAALPGVDPAVTLPLLAAVLAGTADQAPRPFSERPESAGPARIAAFVVEAIQGADGDPELEWEDVAARWAELVGRDANSGAVDLLEATTALRSLCGAVDDASALYCWSTGRVGR